MTWFRGFVTAAGRSATAALCARRLGAGIAGPSPLRSPPSYPTLRSFSTQLQPARRPRNATVWAFSGIHDRVQTPLRTTPYLDMLDRPADSASDQAWLQHLWDEPPAEEGRATLGRQPQRWTAALQTSLTRFWKARGVTSAEAIGRLLAMAHSHPEHRDLQFLRERMAAWDKVAAATPRVDVNRLVRTDSSVLSRDPQIWLGRVRMLNAAYPDLDWFKFMAEYPEMAYIPHWELSHKLNTWAAQMAWAGDVEL